MQIKPDQIDRTDKVKPASAPSDLADLTDRPLSNSGVTGLDDNDQGSEGGRTFKKLDPQVE